MITDHMCALIAVCCKPAILPSIDGMSLNVLLAHPRGLHLLQSAKVQQLVDPTVQI